VSSPGKTLHDLKWQQRLTWKQLSEMMGVDEETVQALMHSSIEYTPDLCAKLETATGVSAAFWRRRWEHWQARKAEGVTPENE